MEKAFIHREEDEEIKFSVDGGELHIVVDDLSEQGRGLRQFYFIMPVLDAGDFAKHILEVCAEVVE